MTQTYRFNPMESNYRNGPAAQGHPYNCFLRGWPTGHNNPQFLMKFSVFSKKKGD